MNKKGFTLIELIAVILVLSIISLIAVSEVNKIIEESRKQAKAASATNYLKAINNTVSASRLDNDSSNDILDGLYVVNDLRVDVEGELPTKGTITILNGIVSASDLLYDKYKITCYKEDKCVGSKASFLYSAEPGLYDYDNKRLLVSWNDLVNKYGLDIEEGGVSTGCNKLTSNNLEGSLLLPQTVKKIGSSKFRKCSALKGIYLPASVKKIEPEALRQSGITFIKFENESNWYVKLADGDVKVDVTAKNIVDRIKRDTSGNQYPLAEWYNSTK